MPDDELKNLDTGEAKVGRFMLRMALVVGWSVAAWLVYTRAEELDVSYTMKTILAGFAAVMALVSLVQALGNYGPEEQEPSDESEDEIEKK